MTIPSSDDWIGEKVTVTKCRWWYLCYIYMGKTGNKSDNENVQRWKSSRSSEDHCFCWIIWQYHISFIDSYTLMKVKKPKYLTLANKLSAEDVFFISVFIYIYIYIYILCTHTHTHTHTQYIMENMTFFTQIWPSKSSRISLCKGQVQSQALDLWILISELKDRWWKFL